MHFFVDERAPANFDIGFINGDFDIIFGGIVRDFNIIHPDTITKIAFAVC